LALKHLGCESGQGYHFSRPLDQEAMSEFLANANLADRAVWLPSQANIGEHIPESLFPVS
jgi:hypothetical protein